LALVADLELFYMLLRLSLVGIVPLLTAFFGFCPAYTALGIPTRRHLRA
jgi:Protein of unknown function (DUF2892)